jgi:hypothetical protein
VIRDVLHDYLAANVPSVGGRVFDKGGASETETKPYLVVVMGPRLNEPLWNGFDGEVQVFIYDDNDRFVDVDRVELEVIRALNNVTLMDLDDGQYYGFTYDRSPTPDDQDDVVLDSYSREVVFRIYSYGWLNGLTYRPDPVDLLSRVTRAMFPEVGTDPATWDVTNPSPAVYWRASRELSRSGLENWGGAWVEVRLTGHVLAPAPNVREEYQRRLAELVSTIDSLPFPNPEDGYMQIVAPVQNDRRANAARQGQLQVDVSFVVWPPPPPGVVYAPTPKLNEINVTLDGMTETVGQRQTP